MITSQAFKKTLAVLAICFHTTLIKAQTTDTAIYLYRAVGRAHSIVNTTDSATSIRVIPPYKLSDSIVKITELYPNGKVMLLGESTPQEIDLKNGNVTFKGNYIAFYPSGKRKQITQFKNGFKDGLEFFYAENGSLSMVKKYTYNYTLSRPIATIEEYYDRNGIKICTNGNGKVIIYDDNLNEVQSGPVKKGKLDGEWRGLVKGTDGLRFCVLYDNGVIKGSYGLDNDGKKYPYTTGYRPAHYRGEQSGFISKLKKEIKFSKGEEIDQAIIDSVQITFSVKKDGTLTDLGTVQPVSKKILEALETALAKCGKWEPTTVCGIPFETQIAASLAFSLGVGGRKHVDLFAVPIYNGQPFYLNNLLIVLPELL